LVKHIRALTIYNFIFIIIYHLLLIKLSTAALAIKYYLPPSLFAMLLALG